MKSWEIPVTWQVCGIVKIEADTLAEAMEIARDDEGTIPLPGDSEYIDGSWQLSMDDPEDVRYAFNDDQKDEGDKNNE